MSTQLSFTKQEQGARSRFRELLTQAESTEDVKKFFYQTVRDLLVDVCDSLPVFNIPDVQLDLSRGEGYSLSDRLMDKADLSNLMHGSDLDDILRRLSKETHGTVTTNWKRIRPGASRRSSPFRAVDPSIPRGHPCLPGRCRTAFSLEIRLVYSLAIRV